MSQVPCLQQVPDNHRVRYNDEGLGTKGQLKHGAMLDEPAARPCMCGVSYAAGSCCAIAQWSGAPSMHAVW